MLKRDLSEWRAAEIEDLRARLIENRKKIRLKRSILRRSIGR
jgi:hypothetical protein